MAVEHDNRFHLNAPLFGYKEATGFLATRGIRISWVTLKKLVLRHRSPITYVGRQGRDRVFEAETLYQEYVTWIRSGHHEYAEPIATQLAPLRAAVGR